MGEFVDPRPAWWHKRGLHMKETPPSDGALVAESGSAELLIYNIGRDSCVVQWEIVHIVGLSSVEGKTRMGYKDLIVAFDLDPQGLAKTSGDADWLKERYDADVAVPGMFIRKGDYLNIPAPGSGCDGDPNLSMKLTEAIKARVASEIGYIRR